MRILLDNNLDHRFGRLLTDHEVVPARILGWAEKANGALLQAAEEAGFDVLITGDKNLRYQQNLTGRRISVVTFHTLFIDLRAIGPLAPRVLDLLATIQPGTTMAVGPENP